MKATDLSRQIARREIVPPVVTTATVLSAFWRKRMSELFPAETVLFDTKTMGQLAALIRLLGDDRALSATAYALSNWNAFRQRVNMELEGTAVASKTPSIGTVLRHRDLLISMMGGLACAINCNHRTTKNSSSGYSPLAIESGQLKQLSH